MKKSSLMLAVLCFALSMTLTGCFQSPADMISEKVGEGLAEKAIESATGGKVDIDSSKGTMNIKSENGNTAISTGGDVKLPDNFPKILVVVDDAKITVATDMGDTSSVNYLTDMSKADLIEKYKSTLVGDGWKKTMETVTDTISMLTFEKDKQTVSGLISDNQNSDNPQKSMVNITLTTKN